MDPIITPNKKRAKLFWKTHETDAGDKYYEDAGSGRTTWTARNSSGVALKDATRMHLGDDGDKKKLFWRTHETDAGDKYYEDTGSGRTTWTARDSSGVAFKKV